MKSFVSLLLNAVKGVTVLHKRVLQLVGVGYRSYIPRERSFKLLILKVGFGGAELGYRIDRFFRARARKQKFLFVGLDKGQLFSSMESVINLKFPVAYTGKGIRIRGSEIILKKTKQQQRNK